MNDMINLPSFNSFSVIRFPYCQHERSVQFRFCKSKKRRTRKKWSKNPANWKRISVCNAFMFRGNLYACDKVIESLHNRIPVSINLGSLTPPMGVKPSVAEQMFSREAYSFGTTKEQLLHIE